LTLKPLSILLASAAIAGCQTVAPPAAAPAATPVAPQQAANSDCVSDETACLNAWFDEKFEELVAFSPIMQTMLGRKTA